jgi:hypothetical protein
MLGQLPMADKSDDLIISISTDLATVRRSLKRLEADIAASSSKVEKQFDTMGKGIDKSMTTALQTRIDKMVGIGTQGAKEWTGALADQGKELERLRAKYNPLFSTIDNYKKSVADIKRAHAVGAISANEMTAAITKERQAALASTAAIKGRNAALADTPSGHSAGADQSRKQVLGYQAFDIGQGVASGMPLGMIAAQQGPQIAQMYAGAGGLKTALGDVATIATGVVSTFGAMPLAIAAAAAAAIGFSKLSTSGAKTAEDAIKSQSEAIAGIKDAYGIAAEGLGDYVKKSQAEASAAARANLKVQQDVAKDEASSFSKTIGVLGARTGGASDIQTKFQPFAAAIREWRKSVAEGTPDFVRFRSQIEAIVALNPDGLRKFGDELLNNSTAAADAERRVKTAKDVIAGLGAIAAGQVGDIASLKDALNELSQIAIPALNDSERALKALQGAMGAAGGSEDRRAATAQYEAALQRISDQNPTVTNPQGVTVPVPVPGQKPSTLDEAPDASIKKAETAAQKAANAYRDLIKSADDRIEQMRLELEITGQYGTATDAARFRLQLLQDAQDKGRTIGDKERADIETRVAAYAGYSEALAKAKLQQDLLTDARMRGMSAQDQKIVQMQRQYGLQEDPNSATGQAIAKSLQLDEIKSASDQFIDNLSGALLSGGGDIGEKLGQLILSELLSSAQKQISGILKQLFSAMLPGGGAPSAAGAVASAASGFQSYAAPVGAVTREALPPPGATTDIAAYIAKAASARGIDPSVALRVAKSEGGLDSWNLQSGVMKNGIREQSYGPFQLYKGGGLGNVFQKKTGLDPAMASSGPAGVDFALDHAKQNGWGSWYGAKNSGIGNFDGINAGSKSASAALEKLAGASTESTKGLSSLASSLAGGAGGAAGAAGNLIGGFDWSKLLSSSFTPNTTLSAVLGLASGGRVVGPGSGTSDSIPAMLSNGEHVTRAAMVKKHGALLDAINSDRIPRFAVGGFATLNGHAPRAPSLSRRQSMYAAKPASQDIFVTVNGASGDTHIRELTRQGVQEAMAADRVAQQRGGFGALQGKFASQKG